MSCRIKWCIPVYVSRITGNTVITLYAFFHKASSWFNVTVKDGRISLRAVRSIKARRSPLPPLSMLDCLYVFGEIVLFDLLQAEVWQLNIKL